MKSEMIILARTVAITWSLILVACGRPPSYVAHPAYQGKPSPSLTILRGQHALAPPGAPEPVRRAIEAGNRLQNKPYRRGGGHARIEDSAYDCSGAVSYVLYHAGLLDAPIPSKGFLRYGEPGPGRWITVYAKSGHVFVIIGGLRLDTGGSKRRTGPRWKPKARQVDGFVLRHPPGL